MLRDAGDLAAWERGYRFAQYTKLLNENPRRLLDVIQRLRFNVSCVTYHKPDSCMLIKASRWRLDYLGGSRAPSELYWTPIRPHSVA